MCQNYISYGKVIGNPRRNFECISLDDLQWKMTSKYWKWNLSIRTIFPKENSYEIPEEILSVALLSPTCFYIFLPPTFFESRWIRLNSNCLIKFLTYLLTLVISRIRITKAWKQHINIWLLNFKYSNSLYFCTS